MSDSAPRWSLVVGRWSLGVLLLTACGTPGASTPTEPAATPVAQAQSPAPTTDLVGTAVAATLTAIAPSVATAETQPTATPTAASTAVPPTAAPPTLVPPTAVPPTPVPPTAVPPTAAPLDQTDYSTVPVFNDPAGLDGRVGVASATAFENDNPIFGDAILMRLFVRNPAAGPNDGDGIESVTFEIQGPDGAIVHRRTERTAGYCAFGGGEPTCDTWRFSEHDNRWPEVDGQQFEVQNGEHFVAMRIQPQGGEAVTWNFFFFVQRP